AWRGGAGIAGNRTLMAHHAFPALLRFLVVCQVDCFALGDDEEQPPEIVAVGKFRKPALLRSAPEAVEGAEGYVFLIRHAARGAAEFLAGKGNHAFVKTLPQWLRGIAIAGAKLVKPGSNTAGRHGRWSPATREFTDR